MADQDHGLDDVRELAQGLRENENPGETREGVRPLKGVATCPRCGLTFSGMHRQVECDLKTRADRMVAALKGIEKLARTILRDSDDDDFRERSVARQVLSLIEHGPDDGESEPKRCTCTWGQKIIIHRDPDCSVHGKR